MGSGQLSLYCIVVRFFVLFFFFLTYFLFLSQKTLVDKSGLLKINGWMDE